MSFPIGSSDEMLAALREHPEWRETLRRQILTEDLLDLPGRLEQAEADRKEEQRQVWEAIRETHATLKSFAEATERRFSEVERRLDGLETTLRSFMEATAASLRGITNKLTELDGGIIEIRAIRKLGNYLYDRMDRIELLDPRTLNQASDIALKAGIISRDERRRVGAADALVAGEDAATGEPACAAVEASGLVEKLDVERAAERAQLLLKILQAAVAAKPAKFAELFSGPPVRAFSLVVGREITEEARREAESKGVAFAKYHNGCDLGRP